MIGLPLDDRPAVQKKWAALGLTGLVFLVVLFGTNLFNLLKIYAVPANTDQICPIYDIKQSHDNSTVIRILKDEVYRNGSIQKWSDAIKVDTLIFDNQPDVDEDPEVWANFQKFHAYLEKTFPTVYEKMEVSTVNTYGLVFYWKGSDPSLKPLMLTAHQDVVPVQKETLLEWTYPPFEGHCDGTYVYGRGSSDCKNVLVAIMETLELLVAEGFEPKRGLLAAFGFDEEDSGPLGAGNIAKYLETKFGVDSLHAIVDEGMGLTVDATTGRIVAMPGTGEKGYADILVELTTPGGHSSVPPDHTSIGIIGELAYVIEKDPFLAIFTPANPTFHLMQCLAVHAENMPVVLRKSILRAGFDKLANSYVVKVLTENLATKYLVQTSQSMDIIVGGEKANALPENVKLLTNHRVAIESTVGEIEHRFTQRVLEVAKRHDLGVEAFGQTILNATAKGKFVVSTQGKTDTAPVTPVGNSVWKNLAGVTRYIYEDFVFTNMTEPIIVSPAIMTGNTDTRHYWNLTGNIYRYSPLFSKDLMKESHIHSVDERMSVANHLQLTAFFYEFVKVSDEDKV